MPCASWGGSRERTSRSCGGRPKACRNVVLRSSIWNYSFFSDPRNRPVIRGAIERYRLPAVTVNSLTDLGAVINYSADPRPMRASAARYADKVLRGANPAELAIEQPRAFLLVVNLPAAKAIGVTIAPSVIAEADRVIH